MDEITEPQILKLKSCEFIQRSVFSGDVVGKGVDAQFYAIKKNA